jgi:hypothetical protein
MLAAGVAATMWLVAGCCGSFGPFECPWDEEEEETVPVRWEEEDTWGVIYECREEGMYRDGVLVVSSDPAVDTSGMCTSSSWTVTATGWQACCDGECCDFQVLDDQKGEGDPCTSGFECAFGLWCRQTADGTVCLYGKEGEWCGEQAFCGDGLYCDEAAGICKPAASQEGGACSGAEESCEFPLSCICLAGQPCACYDGSQGDPCLPDTCQLGLYCAVFGEDEAAHKCYQGDKGDPCALEWHCSSGLECGAISGSDQTVCLEYLLDGQACQDLEDEFTLCGAGLVCNLGYSPNQCKAPGEDGEPCTTDGECAPGWFCVKGEEEPAGACWNGESSDLCLVPQDCAEGLTCDQAGEEMRCFQYLLEGQACAPETAPYVVCSAGLLCNTGFSPSQCAKPGLDGDVCALEAECAEKHFCSEALGKCFDGKDGDPCGADDECAEGWSCPAEIGFCYDGDEGDGCASNEDCAEGLSCVAEAKTCHDGSLGDPCSSNAQCLEGAQCLGLPGQQFCVEFLAEGAECGEELPYSICGQGLTCNAGVEPPQCLPPGEDGDPCAESTDCAEGLTCETGACK